MEHFNETNMSKSGYLKIILGCMYSGKTSKLISIYNHNLIAEIPTCVINYIDDTRYHDNHLSTHDKIMVPCTQVKRLCDIFEKDNIVETVDAFIINEGQFFEDLYDVVKLLVNKYGKSVYVCGLDGDYKMERFGQILDLIPLCDSVEKLRAICTTCKKPAAFTKRLTNETQQKVIGSNNYLPVCRSCHLK
jgi:thymidine kinase